ncbi:MAG: DUF3987 domain-containing protein [Rivularia sp. (in: cyanobacteria)]
MTDKLKSQTVNEVVTSLSNNTTNVAQIPQKPKNKGLGDDFDDIFAAVSAELEADKAASEVKKVAEVPKAVEVETVSNILPNLEFDAEQAIEQLRLLNYQDGDQVFLRAFYPTKHKKKGARKESFKFPHFPKSKIEEWQKDNMGIYFVVNGFGQNKESITHGRALFFEYDDRPKENQKDIWKSLELPTPTFQLDTGGKSIHTYYVYDESVTIEDWKRLQDAFLADKGREADQKIRDASRVMRLAGAWYIKGDGTSGGQSQIITRDGGQYEFNQLFDLVAPQKEHKAAKQTEPSKAIETSPDVETFEAPQNQNEHETLDDKMFIVHSILKGGWLDDCVDDYGGSHQKNSMGWLDVGMALHSIDDCLSCTWDEWSKKSSKYKEEECDRKWETFTADSGGYNLGSLIHVAKLKGWKYPDLLPSAKAKANQTNSQTSSNPQSSSNPNDYLQEVKNAVGENLTGAKLTSKIQEIAGKFKKTSFDVTALYNQFAEELETENGRDERRAEVTELVNLRGSRFDIGEYLPKSLSDPLKMSAKALGVDAEGLLTLLIPNAASMIHVKSRTKAADNGWFPEPFIFYTAIVSPSGNRKSPMLSLVSKPLQDFQEKAKETYDLNLAAYETEHETWECSGKPGGLEPLKPVPMQEYYLEDFTFESIAKIQERQINKSLVIIKDELSGYFNGMGSYKNGKGTDFESFLELWNGKGLKVNRASGDVITVPRLAISLTGGIQPKTLLKMMGDLTDYKGGWARFLYYNAPRRLYKVDLFSKSPNISMLLTEIYQNIAAMPQTEFALDVEATTILESWMQNNETLKAKESREGLVNALAKLVGYVVRLSGLHEVIKSAASGELSTGIVRADSVTAAIKLADFYYQQLVLIHSEAAADSKEAELSPKLAKTLNEAIKKGQLTVRDFIRSNNKASKSDALQIFEELSAMGLGRIEKVKTSVVFIPSPTS